MTARDPIEILVEEHEHALAKLQQLKHTVERIEATGLTQDLLSELRSCLKFIDGEVRAHNEREERFLFPMLEQYVSEPPSVMRSEHRSLWAALSELTRLIDDISQKGDQEGKLRKALDLALYIVELLSNHIAKENNVLFPMAKSILTEEQYDVLRINMDHG